MTLRLAAIIAAHDEAATLGRTLFSLSTASPPLHAIVVVADHCSDDTARVAREGGAAVFERAVGEGAKGASLRWLFEQWPPVLAGCDGVVILDADSSVNAGFFGVMQMTLARVGAAQSFVQPVEYHQSVAATLAAYSELLSQLVDDTLRQRLGWPVPLRGTGMALRAELFRQLLAGVATHTEDIELTLALAERGERIAFAPGAVVYDPKPPDAARVSRQRARWLQGQAQVWRRYGARLPRLLARGPGVWWLLAALLLKPKTAVAMVKLAALAIALLVAAPDWLRLILAAPVVGDVLYYWLGLLLVPPAERARFARALLAAPLYLVVWLNSFVTAMRSGRGWLSARH